MSVKFDDVCFATVVGSAVLGASHCSQEQMQSAFRRLKWDDQVGIVAKRVAEVADSMDLSMGDLDLIAKVPLRSAAGVVLRDQAKQLDGLGRPLCQMLREFHGDLGVFQNGLASVRDVGRDSACLALPIEIALSFVLSLEDHAKQKPLVVSCLEGGVRGGLLGVSVAYYKGTDPVVSAIAGCFAGCVGSAMGSTAGHAVDKGAEMCGYKYSRRVLQATTGSVLLVSASGGSFWQSVLSGVFAATVSSFLTSNDFC